MVARSTAIRAFRIDRLSTAMLDYGEAARELYRRDSQTGPSAWASHQQFSVLGSNGWLRCDFPFAHGRPTACHVYVGDRASHGNVATVAYDFEPVNQYTLQTDRFSRFLRARAVPSWPIEDSLLTLRIIEALFRSAASGGWQDLAPAGDSRTRSGALHPRGRKPQQRTERFRCACCAAIQQEAYGTGP